MPATVDGVEWIIDNFTVVQLALPALRATVAMSDVDRVDDVAAAAT